MKPNTGSLTSRAAHGLQLEDDVRVAVDDVRARDTRERARRPRPSASRARPAPLGVRGRTLPSDWSSAVASEEWTWPGAAKSFRYSSAITSALPSPTRWESSMRMTRSQNSRTLPMSCVTKTMVVPLALERAEVLEALALEGGVADRQHLVDEQDVGAGARGHREGDAHLHARGVVLELLVHRALELGERDDVVVHRVDLGPREAEQGAVEVDVLAPGELGVEADAELDEGHEPAVDARRGRRSAGRCRRGS